MKKFNRFFWNMFDRGIEICAILGISCAIVHPFTVANVARKDIAAHVAEKAGAVLAQMFEGDLL